MPTGLLITLLVLLILGILIRLLWVSDESNSKTSQIVFLEKKIRGYEAQINRNTYQIEELESKLSLYRKVSNFVEDDCEVVLTAESYDKSFDFIMNEADFCYRLKYYELSYLLYKELFYIQPYNEKVVDRVTILAKRMKLYDIELYYIINSIQAIVINEIKDVNSRRLILSNIESYINGRDKDRIEVEDLGNSLKNIGLGYSFMSKIMGLISKYFQCLGNIIKSGMDYVHARDINLSDNINGLIDFRDDFNVSESLISKLNKKIDTLEKELKDKELNVVDSHCNIVNETEMNDTLRELNNNILEKKKQIIELDNQILLQEYGMYSPIYNFANLSEYKYRLDEIRREQKDMILNGTAAICSQVWTINGSISQGKMMTNQNIKQIIRCFNDECDVLINKVKFNNVNSYIDKIKSSAVTLNKMNSKNAIELTQEYIDLKLEELKLAHEYALKKQEEKEEQKRIREQMREEAKLQKEIEEARKEIEKEQKHYSNALIKLNRQIENCSELEKELLLEKKLEIEGHLEDLDVAIKDIDYREANKKAGYVYIISNIGAFGENVYKIGMTRRLDPMERVDELGDASVPFKFDVHAMIFSDDAPKLETALHHAFEQKKVNMVNARREFFNVTLEEIEEVVKANYDKTVEFEKIPQAEQYRESLRLKSSL